MSLDKLQKKGERKYLARARDNRVIQKVRMKRSVVYKCGGIRMQRRYQRVHEGEGHEGTEPTSSPDGFQSSIQ